MRNISFAGLLSVAIFAAAAQGQVGSTGGTYAVGSCKPNLPSYPTISAALAAVPAPTVVDVCPGVYPEQLTITQGVTLQGITSGGAGQAVIAVPSGGLPLTVAAAYFYSVAPQVYVSSSSGPVTLSDITIDGTGNGANSSTYVAGIFFQNSSGTVNHMAVRNLEGGAGGIGVLAEGGISNPSVTIENTSVHDYDWAGIWVDTYGAGASELTATIKANVVNGAHGFYGIVLGDQSTVTVTSNVVLNAPGYGMWDTWQAAGSISSNTLVSNSIGFETDGDAVSVSGNKIVNSTYYGIDNLSAAASITSNTIVGSPDGINFECRVTTGVQANTFMDVGTALYIVPGSYSATNTYYNVNTVRSGGCQPR